MTSSFTFKNLFYGLLILLLAGIMWFTLQTCQKGDNEFGQASETEKGTIGKIGDAATAMKEKPTEMARDAAQSADNLIDKAAEKTSDTMEAAGEMDSKAADDSAGKQQVELAASYSPQASGKVALPIIQGAEITPAGTWRFGDLHFGYDKSELSQVAKASLKHLAAALKTRPELNIEIQGHTDSSGSRNYNLELSHKRALSVKAFLVSEGILASRMKTTGFGPDRPLYSDASGEGFAGNRRVEIKPFF